MKCILFLFFCIISAAFGRICFQTASNNPKSYGECSSSDYCFSADLISKNSGAQIVRGCGGGDILTHGYGVQSCDEFGDNGKQAVNNHGIYGNIKGCKTDFCNSTPPKSSFGFMVTVLLFLSLNVLFCYF